MKRYIAALLPVLLIMTVTPLVSGCGEGGGDEALKALPGLIARAEELNEYIWGAGAPVESYDKEKVNSSSAQYERVTDECPYKTLNELTEAILQVYSTDYCKIIMEIVISGSDDVFARYNEDVSDGRLTRDITNNGFTLRTKLDPANAKVKSRGFNRVALEIPCTFDGEPDGNYTVTVVWENGSWKLDSPTY